MAKPGWYTVECFLSHCRLYLAIWGTIMAVKEDGCWCKSQRSLPLYFVSVRVRIYKHGLLRYKNFIKVSIQSAFSRQPEQPYFTHHLQPSTVNVLAARATRCNVIVCRCNKVHDGYPYDHAISPRTSLTIAIASCTSSPMRS